MLDLKDQNKNLVHETWRTKMYAIVGSLGKFSVMQIVELLFCTSGRCMASIKSKAAIAAKSRSIINASMDFFAATTTVQYNMFAIVSSPTFCHSCQRSQHYNNKMSTFHTDSTTSHRQRGCLREREKAKSKKNPKALTEKSL